MSCEAAITRRMSSGTQVTGSLGLVKERKKVADQTAGTNGLASGVKSDNGESTWGRTPEGTGMDKSKSKNVLF